MNLSTGESLINPSPAHEVHPVFTSQKDYAFLPLKALYEYLKASFYDDRNYCPIENFSQFKKKLDRYFTMLERNESGNYKKCLLVLNESFGKGAISYSEDSVFQKMFPFNKMKLRLANKIHAVNQLLNELEHQ